MSVVDPQNYYGNYNIMYIVYIHIMNNNERIKKKATETRVLGKIIIIIIIRFRQSWNVNGNLQQCYIIMYTHYYNNGLQGDGDGGGMDKQLGQQGRCHLYRENLSGAADIAGSRLRVNYIKYIILYTYIYISI